MILKPHLIRLMQLAVILFLASSSRLSSSQEMLDRLIYLKSFNRALTVCDSLLESGYSADILYKKAIILREQMQFAASLKVMKEAVLADSARPAYQAELADLHSTMGDGVKAVAVYRKAVSLSPDDLPLKAKLGRSLMTMGDFKEAYKIFKEICQADSTNVWYVKNLAQAAFRLEKNREAKELFEKVLGQYPDEYGSYFNLATLYQQDTAFRKTEKLLLKGLERFPGNAGLQQRLAQTYYYMNAYANAVKYYELFLAQSDTSYNSRKEYGVVLFHDKQEEKALALLEPALFLDPTDPVVPFYVGLSHKNLKHFEEAKAYLELSARLAIPYYMTGIHRSMAQIHGLTRQFPQAIESYRKVLELDPDDHEVWFEMATTYEEFESDKTVAYQHYQKYLEKAGPTPLNEAYAKTRMAKIREDLFFKTGKTEILPLK